jgi:RNA polymerase sigma-70 factor (ECF subfamily)
MLNGGMLSDGELLARSATGDTGAFAELYDRHSAAVFRYAWGALRQNSDAQELLQDTFVTAWSRRFQIQLSRESLLPWLLVTCRNHANNLRRRNAYRASVPLAEGDAPPDAAETEDARDRLRWVMEAIDALPPEDRRVCELCLIEGLSYREAARPLGSSASAIGKRLERARMKLRKAVSENES